MNVVFATLFNSSYLLQGVALVESLIRNYPESKILISPLDDLTSEILFQKFKSSKNVFIDNETIRQSYERRLRNLEKINEVIFSLKPILIKNAMKSLQGDMYFYCDADLYFFNRFNFDSISEEMILTEHIFKSELFEHVKYGQYNAGFLGFSKSPSSMACLTWWAKKCKESTANNIENGVMGDQKYLERFFEFTPSIKVIKSPTMNQSVWMLDQRLTISQGPMIDGNLVSSFHFHRLKPYKRVFKTGINQYGKAKGRSELFREVYQPYLIQLRSHNDVIRVMGLSSPKIRFAEFKRFEWSINKWV